MARFKRRAAAKRTSFRGFKARRSKGSSSGSSPFMMMLGGAAYGAGRAYASNLIAPLTAKVPFGNLADNVVLGGISYFAYKKGKGLVKELGRSGLIIESALAGQDLLANMNGSSTSSSASSFSQNWG